MALYRCTSCCYEDAVDSPCPDMGCLKKWPILELQMAAILFLQQKVEDEPDLPFSRLVNQGACELRLWPPGILSYSIPWEFNRERRAK